GWVVTHDRADSPPGRRKVMSVELMKDRWAVHRPPPLIRVGNQLRSRKLDPRGKNLPASAGREVKLVCHHDCAACVPARCTPGKSQSITLSSSAVSLGSAGRRYRACS